jgi:hypothetical protein
MSRELRSCKTHALTLLQVELHPVINAPPRKTSSSACAFAKSLSSPLGTIFLDHQHIKEREPT